MQNELISNTDLSSHWKQIAFDTAEKAQLQSAVKASSSQWAETKKVVDLWDLTNSEQYETELLMSMSEVEHLRITPRISAQSIYKLWESIRSKHQAVVRLRPILDAIEIALAAVLTDFKKPEEGTSLKTLADEGGQFTTTEQFKYVANLVMQFQANLSLDSSPESDSLQKSLYKITDFHMQYLLGASVLSDVIDHQLLNEYFSLDSVVSDLIQAVRNFLGDTTKKPWRQAQLDAVQEKLCPHMDNLCKSYNPWITGKDLNTLKNSIELYLPFLGLDKNEINNCSSALQISIKNTQSACGKVAVSELAQKIKEAPRAHDLHLYLEDLCRHSRRYSAESHCVQAVVKKGFESARELLASKLAKIFECESALVLKQAVQTMSCAEGSCAAHKEKLDLEALKEVDLKSYQTLLFFMALIGDFDAGPEDFVKENNTIQIKGFTRFGAPSDALSLPVWRESKLEVETLPLFRNALLDLPHSNEPLDQQLMEKIFLYSPKKISGELHQLLPPSKLEMRIKNKQIKLCEKDLKILEKKVSLKKWNELWKRYLGGKETFFLSSWNQHDEQSLRKLLIKKIETEKNYLKSQKKPQHYLHTVTPCKISVRLKQAQEYLNTEKNPTIIGLVESMYPAVMVFYYALMAIVDRPGEEMGLSGRDWTCERIIRWAKRHPEEFSPEVTGILEEAKDRLKQKAMPIKELMTLVDQDSLPWDGKKLQLLY